MRRAVMVHGLRGLGDVKPGDWSTVSGTDVGTVPCPGPVSINGSRVTTQCYSYSYLAVAGDSEVAGAQVRGMPVIIWDPNGVLPSVTIMPGDDMIAVMKANNVPIAGSPDGGLGYEYMRHYNAEFPQAAHGYETVDQVTIKAIQQTLADGWTPAQMMTAGFTAQQLGAAGAVVPASSTPVSTSTADAAGQLGISVSMVPPVNSAAITSSPSPTSYTPVASTPTPASSAPGMMPGETQAVPTPASATASTSSSSSSTSAPASTSACSFALFGETTCWGPIGSTTALVIGAALLALFMMGGKH